MTYFNKENEHDMSETIGKLYENKMKKKTILQHVQGYHSGIAT